jgi:hypothetical protein
VLELAIALFAVGLALIVVAVARDDVDRRDSRFVRYR